MSEKNILVFTIDAQITPSDYTDLVDFIYRNYVAPNLKHFTNIARSTSETGFFLFFTAVDPDRKWYIDVQISIGKPISVRMVLSSSEVPGSVVNWLRSNLVAAVRFFEEQLRKTTVYFTWVEGEEIIPERVLEARKNFVYRMFSESMLLLFILFTSFSIILFLILGSYAPITLVLMQFTLILFSDRIIGRMGDWRITEKNPLIHVFQYNIPVSEYKSFLNKHGAEIFSKIKKEIYSKTLALGKPINYEVCAEVLSQYGLEYSSERVSAKSVNLYEIVKQAAEKFELPVPKIVVSNTTLPNAAASGAWPSRGVILVTTGLLVQLEDKEILSVIGHEFSHLRGRDPLFLFLLTSMEYLLRFYVFWPLLYFLGYFYLIIALGAVYFVAKFFESKADLESAIKIGEPQTLANALRKIGFRRLQLEARRGYAIQEWLGWDPHPPLYFRIYRLESLRDPSRIRHPLIRSVKDNILGFLEIIG
ncbi:MAG: M48 family metalloprotease [Candidatus Brockarchaeota archaeon]|nr:M48 family metalloprotease [Candidatus Brockarchaeota archaeon]